MPNSIGRRAVVVGKANKSLVFQSTNRIYRVLQKTMSQSFLPIVFLQKLYKAFIFFLCYAKYILLKIKKGRLLIKLYK